ncbi:cytochrome C oxidase subunit II [Candidatus Woesearchaeota archaeon CG10_big_fil_rev_8_21_14_0_10_37_12]|nr:MAG: cytochrome C oxidase subunit II [Candidatus Woesearchaeota archaeon CG10_big_fil_rev_8_21_14_0_10_37_12]
MKKRTITFAIFGLLFLAACNGATGNVVKETVDKTGEIKELTIDAHNWAFTQENVVINKGDTVRIKVTSSEGIHGLKLPEFDIETGPISPGQEETVEFVADKTGTFEYKCNVPCGPGHREMKGKITVE